MVRNLLATLALITSSTALAGSPALFSGSDVLLLKPNISLDRDVKIQSGSIDPSSTGSTAPIGSIFLRHTTGGLYLKTNTADTDWDQVTTSASAGNLTTNSVTASTTLTSSNDAVFADASNGDITLTLPAASSNDGKRFYIKKTDDSNGQVIIIGGGNIDDEDELVLVAPKSAVTLISDGGQWNVF